MTVDFFTSKVYLYPVKTKNVLLKKLALFSRDIQQKREHVAENAKMKLQKNLELVLNEIKKINKKYLEMFSSRVHGGKAYSAEQKIREFKKLLFKSKRVHRATSNKRFEKLIRLAVKNMNNIRSQKYVMHLVQQNKNRLKNKNFRSFMIFIDL